MIAHPFPGLRPFGREEDAIFFGRESQVDDLLDRLQETHFLAVIGTSGSGKSSLVRAGLLPALDSGFLAGAGARWTIAELRPGDRPFARLAASLLRDTDWEYATDASEGRRASTEQRVSDLEQDLRRGNLALNWRLGIHPLPEGTRLLILVDQFEELFRYCRTDSAEAAAFVALLLGAAAHPQVYVVMTMRSEFIGDCSRFPGLPEAINAGLFLTPGLTPEQIADAIQLPARLFAGEVQPELVRTLLAQAKEESDRLPLLQHALMRLWDLGDSDHVLSLHAFDGMGGLRQALDDHAEEAFSELDPDQRPVAEALLRSLAERSIEERDTRRPVRLGEVAELAGTDTAGVAAVVEVLRAPGRNFLTPPAGKPLENDTVLDIAHEALIRQWRRLHELTADEAERAELYQRLQAAAQRWQDGKGALWVDPDLEFALQWQRRTQPSAVWARRYGGDFDVAMAFLDAGRVARERGRAELESRRRQSLRRARATAVIAVVGLTLVAGIAGWGWVERQRALQSEQQRTRNLFDSSLTHSALLTRTEDHARARRILAGTGELDQDVPLPRRVARDLLARYAATLGGAPDKVYKGPGSPLSQAAISADGRWLAACGERGTLVLFDAASGALRHRLKGHDPAEQIRDCEFDPAGRWLASAGNDRRIILWSVPDAAGQPGILRQWLTSGAVMSLAVGPDGLIATGSEDGTITLREAGASSPLRTLMGHEKGISEVTGLAFAPEGGRLASASDDGTARIWDVHSGSEIARFNDHREAVKSVAFSADGRYLATGGSDRRVVLWDIRSREAVRVFSGHRNTVYGLAFAERTGEPDAPPLLVAGGFDRSLRVWGTDSTATVRLLQGHGAAVNGIVVREDRLYSASSDGTVRRWDLSLPHQRLLDLGAEPASTAVSPDGRLLAVGFANGGLSIYSLPGLSMVWHTDHAHTVDLQRLMFSADGALLASGGFDAVVRIWRALPDGALEPLHNLIGHHEEVHDVAFSRDASMLATASYDGRIGLFDTASGAASFIESTGWGQVLSVAFDPGGRSIYAAYRDAGKIGVWDISHNPPVLSREFEASRDWLMWAEPDAGGRQLAAVGRDYVVSVLDASDGTRLHLLPGHENAVLKARFLPGGGQLATVGVDATVRLWDLATETELFALRLPSEQGPPSPLWDFDMRCTATGCWLAVPLTRGKLAVYDFGKVDAPMTR